MVHQIAKRRISADRSLLVYLTVRPDPEKVGRWMCEVSFYRRDSDPQRGSLLRGELIDTSVVDDVDSQELALELGKALASRLGTMLP